MNPTGTQTIQTSAQADRAHDAACWLATAIALGLMFSPPLANLAELLLVAVMLSAPSLRQRLWHACRRPLVLATLAFGLMIGLGVSYSVAPPDEAWSMLGGWRKLLLLPLALALFEEARWKRRFLLALISVSTLSALASFALWGMGLVLNENEAGVLLRNHSFQGCIFAVSAFACAVLALEQRQRRGLLLAAALLLVANIVLVTPGRSGYLVLVVCALALAGSARFLPVKSAGGRAAFVLLAVAALLAALALAPTSRQRILQAVRETGQYDQAKELTSMGIRVIFWKNSLELIRARPLAGYGTGGFASAYAARVQGGTGIAGTLSGDPHNQYMKIAAEHGLIGLALFLALLLAALREPAPQPWRLLGAGVLLAWCATSMANSHFSTFSEGSFIYLWLGVMLAGRDATAAESVLPETILLLLPEGEGAARHAEVLTLIGAAADAGGFELCVIADGPPPAEWSEDVNRRWLQTEDAGAQGMPLRRRWRLLRAQYARLRFRFVFTLTTADQRAAGLWRAAHRPRVFVLRLWQEAEHLRGGAWQRLALSRHTAVNFFASVATAEALGSAGNAGLALDNPCIFSAAPLSCTENKSRLCAALTALARPTRERQGMKPAQDSSHIRLTYVTHFYLNQNRSETITELLQHYAGYAPELLDRIHFVVVDDASPLRVEAPALDLNLTWLRVDEDIRWNQGGARNLGVTYAKSDQVLLTDLDLLFPEATLRALTEARPCGKNIFKLRELDEASGELRKGHPNTFFLSRARFLRFYGYDEEFAGNYGAEDFRFVKFQKSQGSRQRSFDSRYPYLVRHKIDRTAAYHSLQRDLSDNTPVDSRKRFENEVYGHEHGHSRMFLNFTWTVVAQLRRAAVPAPAEDRGWKRRWLLRTLLPW
jgi:O-antigen ligase